MRLRLSGNSKSKKFRGRLLRRKLPANWRNGAPRCKKLQRRQPLSRRRERKHRGRLKSRPLRSVEQKPRRKRKLGACKCRKSRSGNRRRQLRLQPRLQESRERRRKPLPKPRD